MQNRFASAVLDPQRIYRARPRYAVARRACPVALTGCWQGYAAPRSTVSPDRLAGGWMPTDGAGLDY